MPTIDQNLSLWNHGYSWAQAGDEWSAPWGSSEAMWWTSLYPRIRKFLPAGTILEIAPGYGRCTEFLKDHCKKLIGVDLSPKCAEACSKRFRSSPHVEFLVNDGKSLDMIPDGSIDFVFSFDSLVHAKADVLHSYSSQLARKLAPKGVGFLHHSNLGAFGRATRWTHLIHRTVPKPVRNQIVKRGWLIDTAWRGEDMTADLFRAYCAEAGLHCLSQELINWANRSYLIDCFSVFSKSPVAQKTTVIGNPYFLKEVENCKSRLQTLSV